MTSLQTLCHAPDTPLRRVPLLTLALLAAFGCAAAEPPPAGAGLSHTPAVRLVSAGSVSTDDAPRPEVPEPLVDSARSLLAQGRPWRATQLLAPLLADPARRTPAAVHVAALAAAAWGGWTHVERLLRDERWLDSLDGGEGHALLARAALERGWSRGTIDSSALPHARRAVARARSEAERAPRLALLARASERSGLMHEAISAYLAVGDALPSVRAWFTVRAVALHGDSLARARLMASIPPGLARERGVWADAQARELHGDVEGAARAYAAAGSPSAALRVRLEGGADSQARDTWRGELLAIVQSKGDAAEAREAVALLDRFFAPLSAAEELAVARTLATGGPTTRAVSAYAAAARGDLLTTDDRFAWGTALARLGRNRDAAAQFARAAERGPLAAEARYQRARSLLRAGDGAAATSALERLAADFPADNASAAMALYLLGDLAGDAGRDAMARQRFREVARRHPRAPIAARARFRAAIIAFADGAVRAAAQEMDSLSRRDGHAERTSSLYWAGRAWERAGDSAAARLRWRQVIERDPPSYYAILAARRLGIVPWRPAPASTALPALPGVDSALSRAALLEEVGMGLEARFEYDGVERLADSAAVRMVATGAALRDGGQPSRGIRLGLRALARGAPRDEALYRVIYPLAWRDVIAAEAGRHGLDDGFVAALIRQESNFTPGATSVAGARGLMQVMPSVGRALAQGRGFPLWDAALLYQPDVSIQLGTAHLAAQMTRYRDPVRVLAAYNAGGSRVDRWSRLAGASDPELFVERIPFVETRDYVRIVLRNREFYRSLYAS